MNALEMATAERTELADLLATLTPEQWLAPSLCEGWRVRDVVAHVMSFDRVTALGMVRRAVRGRLIHINQVLAPTDLDWSHGSGPEVTGPAEALPMAVAGRSSAVDELSGPGQPVLAARLAR